MFGICGIVGKQHSQLFNSFKKTLEFTKCDSFEAYTFHDCSIGIAEAKKASCQKTNKERAGSENTPARQRKKGNTGTHGARLDRLPQPRKVPYGHPGYRP